VKSFLEISITVEVAKTKKSQKFLRRRWCWGVGQCVKPTNDREVKNT